MSTATSSGASSETPAAPGTASRRGALRLIGGASAAAGAAVAVTGAPAEAATYAPGRFSATPVLSTQARHLANRFSFGITAGLAADVRAAGGHLAWFEQQIEQASAAETETLCDWWPDLHDDAATLWQQNLEQTGYSILLMRDYGRRLLMRRMRSPHQVLEVMTKFWENHVHVPTSVDNIFVFRVEYGDVVRQHALGRFEDLLKATVLHPAMLMFLNAGSSTKAHPNENLGRELLELHTLGVGNYTEDDVKNSARILTGYRSGYVGGSWTYDYVAANHWTGPVQVLDFTDPNEDADGQAVCDRYLTYLAHHPATARRIATKLVRKFVSDEVSEALVERLAQVYLDNDTAIVPVLRELVGSAEFAGAVDAKLRDADEDVIATYRLLGADIRAPRRTTSAADEIYWQVAALGLEPGTWPRPDGPPIDNESWASPTRALASMSLHWNMAGGWFPTTEVSYRKPASWVPRPSGMVFRDLVDHLSRVLLQRPSTAQLLQACCAAAGTAPRQRVAADGDLFGWSWPRMVAAVLDSPAFYQH